MSFITERFHRLSTPVHLWASHTHVWRSLFPRARLLTRNELYVSLVILSLIGAIFLVGESVLAPVAHELMSHTYKVVQ